MKMRSRLKTSSRKEKRGMHTFNFRCILPVKMSHEEASAYKSELATELYVLFERVKGLYAGASLNVSGQSHTGVIRELKEITLRESIIAAERQFNAAKSRAEETRRQCPVEISRAEDRVERTKKEAEESRRLWPIKISQAETDLERAKKEAERREKECQKEILDWERELASLKDEEARGLKKIKRKAVKESL